MAKGEIKNQSFPSNSQKVINSRGKKAISLLQVPLEKPA